MNDLRLDSKIAVVTGASSGIGLATALRATSLGASVMNLDVDAGHPDIAHLECDVASYEQVAQAFERIGERFGAIDCIVNNAGIVPTGSFHALTPESWNRTIAINLTGTYNCCRAGLPLLRAGGSIINVS